MGRECGAHKACGSAVVLSADLEVCWFSCLSPRICLEVTSSSSHVSCTDGRSAKQQPVPARCETKRDIRRNWLGTDESSSSGLVSYSWDILSLKCLILVLIVRVGTFFLFPSGSWHFDRLPLSLWCVSPSCLQILRTNSLSNYPLIKCIIT